MGSINNYVSCSMNIYFFFFFQSEKRERKKNTLC